MVTEEYSVSYEAGRILHDAWYNVGRAIAPPFDLIDKFDRLRWIEAAKISNSAEREACAQVCENESKEHERNAYGAYDGRYDWKADGANDCADAIRARGNT